MAMEPNQVGKLEIPVEFKLDKKTLDGRFKADVEAAAKQTGRRQAEVQAAEYVKALEQQYQRRLGEAREELMRGLIDVKEFQRRGREAAQAMNKAILDELQRRGVAGRLGSAYTEDFNVLSGAFKNVDVGARRGAAGIGEMRESFASLLAQAAGVHPVLGRIVNVIGGVAAGSVVMGAVLAGLSALVYAWKKVTESTREAREETESATERLKELRRMEELGPGGQTKADVETERAELDRLTARRRGVERELQRVRAGGVVDPELQGTMERAKEARLAELAREADELAELIRVGQEKVSEAEREAGRERLRAFLEGREPERQAHRQAQQDAEREREKAQQEAEKAAERLAGLEDDMRRRLATLTATAADDLLLALDMLEAEAREAAHRAGTEVSDAFLAGLAELRSDAEGTRALEGWQAQLQEILRLDRGTMQQRALSGFTERLRREAAALKEGSRLRKEYIELARRAEDAHKKNAEAIDTETDAQERRNDAEAERARTDELRDLRDRAQLIEENARAAVQLANAMGLVGDEAAAVLENIAQLGSAIYRIAGDDLTAIPSALGATAQILKSLFSGNDQAAEEARRAAEQLAREMREQARQIRENTEALREFARRALSGTTGTEWSGLLAGAQSFWDWLRKAFGDPYDVWLRNVEMGVGRDSLKLAAEGLGMSESDLMRLLETMEELTGIEFFDLEKGITSISEFFRAMEAMQAKGIGVFDESLGGALDAMRFRWQLMGEAIGGAAERVEEFISVLRRVPEGTAFADALARAMAEGGPAAANAMIDELAKRLAGGDQSLFAPGGMFAGLTAEEVRRLLEEGNDLIEEMLRGPGAGTTQDFVQARSITEITATRIEGALYTENALSSERNALLRQLVGMQMSPSMVAGFVPGTVSPAAYAPPASSGGVAIAWHQHAPLIDGGIQVSGIKDEGIIQEVRDQVMGSVRAGIDSALDAAAIDRALGRRYRDRQRTLGRS